jgi:hypothetical protein
MLWSLTKQVSILIHLVWYSVDPSALGINSGPGNNMSHIILPNGDPYSYIMVLSTGYVAYCNLISPKVTRTSDNKWHMKRIFIIYHTQEFE